MTTPDNNTNICLLLHNLRVNDVSGSPFPRREIVSPYGRPPFYSIFQLDMRRKAEILQYNGNATNTKTNNQTKAERFSQVVNGNSQYQRYLANLDVSCQIETNKYTPSYFSNVPPPYINLQYDPNIPLYNYADNLTNGDSGYSGFGLDLSNNVTT
jgi:hypothetical protein